MRKVTVVGFLVLSLLIGAFGLVQAQTPAPQGGEAAPIPTELAPDSEEIPGASIEIIAESTSDTDAVGMTLYRITLEPGVEIPEHEHFGAVTWYVDSGEVTVTLDGGEAWVRCEDCVPGATPDESGFALVPAGTEVVLQAGDWMIQHDTTVHAYTNTGDADVVIEASTTWPVEEFSDESATPTLLGTPAAGPPIRPRGCRGGCY
jgi:hypothetical protein